MAGGKWMNTSLKFEAIDCLTELFRLFENWVRKTSITLAWMLNRMRLT
jgi:hypothetical protein